MFFSPVIISTHNKDSYISRSLDSVFGQSLRDFELVVIDERSTDEGASIVALYRDHRIRLIRQENRGACVARNRGILEVETTLPAFLYDSDEYFQNILEKMPDFIGHECLVPGFGKEAVKVWPGSTPRSPILKAISGVSITASAPTICPVPCRVLLPL